MGARKDSLRRIWGALKRELRDHWLPGTHSVSSQVHDSPLPQHTPQWKTSPNSEKPVEVPGVSHTEETLQNLCTELPIPDAPLNSTVEPSAGPDLSDWLEFTEQPPRPPAPRTTGPVMITRHIERSYSIAMSCHYE